MKTSDFYYDLPEELIAQDPLEDRSSSRLLVLDKKTGKTEHHVFREITDYLNPGDCLVLNDTKVIPARLIGVKEETGAKIEVLLLKRGADDVWETLVKPGKKARPGARISFGDGLLVGEVMEVVEEGNRLIHFEYEGIFEEILDQLGQMPLPPYITHQLQDKNRYNTVISTWERRLLNEAQHQAHRTGRFRVSVHLRFLADVQQRDPVGADQHFSHERDDFRGHHGGGQYPGAVSAAVVRRDFRPVQKQDGPQETFCPFRDDRGSDPDAAASAGGQQLFRESFRYQDHSVYRNSGLSADCYGNLPEPGGGADAGCDAETTAQ